MKRTSIFKATLALVMLTTALLAAPASAQTTTVNVSYSWTAPTTGSAVTSYVIQQSIDGGTWTQIATSSTNSYTLAASIGHTHSIRVAGVDASARQGVWSDPSVVYTPDAGAPGKPGTPVRI
jgi:hypothetical protein